MKKRKERWWDVLERGDGKGGRVRGKSDLGEGEG